MSAHRRSEGVRGVLPDKEHPTPARRRPRGEPRSDPAGATPVTDSADSGSPAARSPSRASLDAQASFWRWARIVSVLLALFLGWQLFLIARGLVLSILNIVLYVVFGTIVAFIGAPLARALERRLRIPRTLASLAALLSEILVLALLVWLISGPLIGEARSLAKALPSLFTRAQSTFNQVQHALAQHGINIGSASSILNDLPGKIAPVLTGIIFTAITQSLGVVLDVVVVIVTAFWLIRDGGELRRSAVSLLPGRARTEIDFALDAIGVVIGGYVRGQLLMAALIGFLAWFGCTIIGVPYPIVVGVAAGLFELIPLVGPFVGGAVATLLAFTVGPVLAVETIGLFVVIHVLEGYVISPRVQAHFVQLHPLVAFLALIAGIEVDGFLGALFAVPVASILSVLVRAYVGDLRAAHPEMFTVPTGKAKEEGRHRRMLRSFRLISPDQRRSIRETLSRLPGRSSTPQHAAGAHHEGAPGGPEGQRSP